MIQNQTLLKVADNSGAKLLRVIRVLGGTRKRYARIGDVVVASVKLAEPRKAVKKKEIVRAVVVRQKQSYRRKDGFCLKFDDNAAVILEGKQSKEPKGGRIFGPIPRELRERGYIKLISLAREVI